VSVFMLSAAAYLSGRTTPEPMVARESFASFPSTIGDWTGREAEPFTADILAVLGVDEHVSRIYRNGRADVALYIGYYRSQRQGDTIHSPLNCLPGAGWQPMTRRYKTVSVPGGSYPIRVNEILIQKGLDRQLVLYWYQSHGRVEPNEYWSKVFMVYDAVRLNRTDAALVRVVTPLDLNDEEGNHAAARATQFVETMYPLLGSYLPQ
jgi:EpsI family protein